MIYKTPGRAKKEKQGANCLPESKISPAFKKAAESKDSVFGRSAHGAKFFSLQKRRRGDRETSRDRERNPLTETADRHEKPPLWYYPCGGLHSLISVPAFE